MGIEYNVGKEGGKDDIVGAIKGYLEIPEQVRRELQFFTTGFNGFMGLLEEMKKIGTFGGIIPEEVTDSGFGVKNIAGIPEVLRTAKKGTDGGLKNRFIPVMGLDKEHQQVTFTLKLIPATDNGSKAELADDTATVDAAAFNDDFKIMADAVKYLHASPARPKEMPRLYAFIKAVALCYAPEAKPVVDRVMLDDFLKSAPIKLCPQLEEEAYRAVFNDKDDKARLILSSFIGVQNVTAENFKEWLETFQPKKHQVKWHQCLQGLVKEKMSETIAQCRKEFLATVADKSPRAAARQFPGLKEAETRLQTKKPVAVKEDTSSIPEKRAEVKDKAMETAAEAWRPAVHTDAGPAVVVNRIINVGDPLAEDQAKKAAMPIIEAFRETLSSYLGDTALSFRSFRTICEMVFDDTIPWVRDNKVDWELIISDGHIKPFENFKNGNKDDLNFTDDLFVFRRELDKKGLRTQVIRELFVRQLKSKTRHHE
jgi:hypothetical protein